MLQAAVDALTLHRFDSFATVRRIPTPPGKFVSIDHDGIARAILTSAQQAALIDSFMEQVVQKGTGTAARISGVRVTGKTGTAENAGGADHAWFIGTADVGGRKISFAIIVENSGGGGIAAAPIARKIILSME